MMYEVEIEFSNGDKHTIEVEAKSMREALDNAMPVSYLVKEWWDEEDEI